GKECARAFQYAYGIYVVHHLDLKRLRPNGWRVSGERRAEGDERVRCTRMLGAASSCHGQSQYPFDERRLALCVRLAVMGKLLRELPFELRVGCCGLRLVAK